MAETHKESERKGVASFKGGSEPEQEQLVVTINTPTGKIVNVEKIDKAGKHHEIDEEEWATLVGDEAEDIDVALEEAFEAGIAAVLGEEVEDEGEDDEERTLRRFLIGRLLHRRSVQRRILQRVLATRLLRRQFLERTA
jgi:hypothetical protein